MDKLSNQLKQSAAREAVKLSAPNRKRAHIAVGFAGSVLTEKSFGFPKEMPEREGFNVMPRKKKHAEIVPTSHAGAALTQTPA
jgi:hypothetical protein